MVFNSKVVTKFDISKYTDILLMRHLKEVKSGQNGVKVVQDVSYRLLIYSQHTFISVSFQQGVKLVQGAFPGRYSSFLILFGGQGGGLQCCRKTRLFQYPLSVGVAGVNDTKLIDVNGYRMRAYETKQKHINVACIYSAMFILSKLNHLILDDDKVSQLKTVL